MKRKKKKQDHANMEQQTDTQQTNQTIDQERKK